MSVTAQVSGRMRPIIADSFTDKKTGEVIHYMQLQIESIDADSNRVEITRVSVPKDMRSVTAIEKNLLDKDVACDVDVTSDQAGRIKYKLLSMPKPITKPSSAAA